MNIYKVPYIIKDGGYISGDMVTSGGFYDVHRYEIITASSSKKAKEAVQNLDERYLVKRPTKLGKA